MTTKLDERVAAIEEEEERRRKEQVTSRAQAQLDAEQAAEDRQKEGETHARRYQAIIDYRAELLPQLMETLDRMAALAEEFHGLRAIIRQEASAATSRGVKVPHPPKMFAVNPVEKRLLERARIALTAVGGS